MNAAALLLKAPTKLTNSPKYGTARETTAVATTESSQKMVRGMYYGCAC